MRITLTADGRKLAGVLVAEVATLVEPRLQELSAAEQQRLGTLLRRILG